MKLTDIAVKETRTISDAENTGFSMAIIEQSGWWDRATGRFLGCTKAEAEDNYACQHFDETIVWD